MSSPAWNILKHLGSSRKHRKLVQCYLQSPQSPSMGFTKLSPPKNTATVEWQIQRSKWKRHWQVEEAQPGILNFDILGAAFMIDILAKWSASPWLTLRSNSWLIACLHRRTSFPLQQSWKPSSIATRKALAIVEKMRCFKAQLWPLEAGFFGDCHDPSCSFHVTSLSQHSVLSICDGTFFKVGAPPATLPAEELPNKVQSIVKPQDGPLAPWHPRQGETKTKPAKQLTLSIWHKAF